MRNCRPTDTVGSVSDVEALHAVAAEISARLRVSCRPGPERAVHGGSICACYLWRAGERELFVKIAPASSLDMFEAEADGLRELAGAAAVRVPQVLAVGTAGPSAYLALEWIETGPADEATEAALGQQLARLHRKTAQRHGWWRDNYIGRTPQVNGWMDDWTAFFRERRLRYQLDLAVRNGYGAQLEARGERLLEVLGALLAGHRPVASLLHGDLWGGNWLAGSGGQPVIFDPAVYYGDRETDLAMTHLFGGFGRRFYRAYMEAWPLPEGHELRREIYNLYHVLNHANLFGGGYVQQARRMIDRLLSEAGC